MPDVVTPATEYESLVSALKSLTQGEAPNAITLPMAEDEWDVRPDTVSYGIVALEFEADAMDADGVKQVRAMEGSTDLFSLKRDGAGWKSMIEATLTEKCGASWKLNSRTYEQNTGLFHWEWVFQVEE